MTAVLLWSSQARLASISQVVMYWAHLLVLLQSALQLLVALAQPRMLPLLRVKLLHGQSHFRGVPAAHTRRSGLIKMT